VRDRGFLIWAVLLGVAVVAPAVAVLVAHRQARALAGPLEDLSRHCRAVTEGDLGARAAPSSIAENDQVPAQTTNGTVRLVVRDLDDALALDVTDEGEVPGTAARLFDRGHSGGGQGTGIGLALARDLAFSLGGRLSLTGRAPTTFTLLVPVGRDRTVDGTA
jgi:nitrogen fixation/metabolism regulation signal transduction histidine kinase